MDTRPVTYTLWLSVEVQDESATDDDPEHYELGLPDKLAECGSELEARQLVLDLLVAMNSLDLYSSELTPARFRELVRNPALATYAVMATSEVGLRMRRAAQTGGPDSL